MPLLLEVCALRVENNYARSSEDMIIIDSVNLEILKNSITCLLGESGAGKTILARALAGLIPANLSVTGGTFKYNNQPLTYPELEKRRGRISFYSPQDASATFNPVLKLGKQIQENSGQSLDDILEILTALNYSLEDARRVLVSYPFQLSDGENQRCLLALALSRKCPLLILDEPFSAFDPDSLDKAMRLILNYKAKYGFSFLLITHQLSVAMKISDTFYLIKGGKIIDQGKPGTIFQHATHPYTLEIRDYLTRIKFFPG